MPQSRVPFSATVDPTTLEVLDEIAEERDESRSGTVDAVVEEWVQQQQRLESAGQEIDQLREQLNAERERAEQAEQERRELAEQADDTGGGRASTFVDQLAAAALVVAPVAFALGTPSVAGGLLAVVGGWLAGTLTPLGAWIAGEAASLRNQVGDAGGVFAFFHKLLIDGSVGVEDPETPVESATRLDAVAAWLAVAFTGGSLAVAFGPEWVRRVAFAEPFSAVDLSVLVIYSMVTMGGAIVLAWVAVFATGVVHLTRVRAVQGLKRAVERVRV